MTSISLFGSKVSNFLPKEALTLGLGIGIGSVSSVALQFFQSSASNWISLPTIAKNVVRYSFGVGIVVGVVLSVYSTIRLAQKIFSEKKEVEKMVGIVALGVLFTATTEAIAEHVWQIAPSFDALMGHSIAYCIGTNLIFQACCIAGLAGVIFTAYGAYRLGKSLAGE